jgi:hypothetical protein
VHAHQHPKPKSNSQIIIIEIIEIIIIPYYVHNANIYILRERVVGYPPIIYLITLYVYIPIMYITY